MASTETQVAKEAPHPPKSEATHRPPPSAHDYSIIDVTLRVLLFAATITSLVVLVTSKQTVQGPTPTLPLPMKFQAKFDDAPAFIYLLVALAVTAFYSIITTLASIVQKSDFSAKFLFLFAFWDTLMLGVLASALGAAGGIAYTGLKGNKHVQWGKVCNNFDKFCRHIGSSLFVALIGSILLVLLLWFNIFRIHKRISH